MENRIKGLIKAKKIQVKLGSLYCHIDKNGNKEWYIEQIPMIKQ